jgi:ferritin
MISKKMVDALNEQVDAELYSAYLYLAMEAYFHDAGFSGLANWMHVQTLEETTHAMKIFDFIVERGGRAALKAIEKPQETWKSPVEVFKAVCNHEQKVTGLINGLVDLAIKEKDHATNSFLQWFVDEQVEEEASADAILQKLKMVQDAPGGLFMMDKELASRVFTPPATEGE